MTEVLVVTGVIAILLAISIPAVQYSREAARRTQCQSNQRQILLACQAFEATNGSLPSLYNGTSLAYPLQEWDLFHMHSWRVELLPYLEQQALRDRIEWSAMATDPVNKSVREAVVPVYVCPSVADPVSNMGWGAAYAEWPNLSVPFTGTKYFATRSDREQTPCSGNSRFSSVCLLVRIEWNNRGQREAPARRSQRVISLRRLAFFQPTVVLAAAWHCGAGTKYSLLSPTISNGSLRIGRNTGKIGQLRMPRPSCCWHFGSG